MVTRETHVEIHLPDTSSQMPLPFAEGGIRAGFPSPAQDYSSESIDLNTELIAHPAATFYGRVIGDSMSGEGIEEGDKGLPLAGGVNWADACPAPSHECRVPAAQPEVETDDQPRAFEIFRPRDLLFENQC